MNGTSLRRFGSFELDLAAERLLKNGRTIRIQPKPLKLLCLLTNKPGALITREEIQSALWADNTFVDFEQGVNFAVKQVRDALGDSAENSLYVQTVPKRGYRFLAPVESGPVDEPVMPTPAHGDASATELQKALWANIAELRMADWRRQRRDQAMLIALGLVVLALIWIVIGRA
jgi:DNA-binding winged helix-turn-helix (wHTH) protein